MFITNTAFKSPHFAFLNAPHEDHWTAVELLTHSVWFLVTIRLTDEKNQTLLRRTVLLTDVADVERLAQQPPDVNPKFESVLIITPSWLNGSNTWQMDPLAAVWIAPAPPGHLKEVEIYETHSGLRYGNFKHSRLVDEHEKQTLRYRFPVQ